ncbi:MAG: hypothetical protein ABFD62_07435 [Syntrophaceae bacterium]
MAQPGMLEISESPLWEKLKARRVPLSFDMEVTARCNNNCLNSRRAYIRL